MPKLKQYQVDWNDETRVLGIPQENMDAEIGMTDFPPIPDPWHAILHTRWRVD